MIRANQRLECLGQINDILYQDYRSLISVEEYRINQSIQQVIECLDLETIKVILIQSDIGSEGDKPIADYVKSYVRFYYYLLLFNI